MATKIFVNLPVKDLKKSVEFFTRLGYTFNPQFTDENATCMIISDTIFVMLLVHPFFESFTKKPIPDVKASEVILALSAESKAEVDSLIAKAIKAGGSALNPIQDQGWMYTGGFQDLDGHLWEIAYMDERAIPKN